MLAAVAIVPGSPSLVPELTGPATVGSDDDLEVCRAAVRGAVTRLAGAAPQRWVAVCAADAHDPVPLGDRGFRHGDLPVDGTFAGFGVDVRVRLAPGTPPADVVDAMPTTLLAAAWMRTRFAPTVTVDPVLVASDVDGTALAAPIDIVLDRVDRHPEPVGLLAVVDGSVGLTAKAPGGLIDGADAVQDTVDAAIAAGDLDAIAGLDSGVCARARLDGRVVLQIAAAAWSHRGDGRPVAASLWRGAPLGVGGHVAWWQAPVDEAGV